MSPILSYILILMSAIVFYFVSDVLFQSKDQNEVFIVFDYNVIFAQLSDDDIWFDLYLFHIIVATF